MDKITLRHRRSALSAGNRLYGKSLVVVPPSEWPEHLLNRSGSSPNRAMRSRDFLVQIFYEKKDIVRLSINRTAIGNDGMWLDGITWDQMQAIKAEAGYADCDAVEVFPADKDLVNVANIRHLWVMPRGFQFHFAWRKTNPLPTE